MSKEAMYEKALEETMSVKSFTGYDEKIRRQIAQNGIVEFLKAKGEEIDKEDVRAFVEKVFDEEHEEAETWKRFRELVK